MVYVSEVEKFHLLEDAAGDAAALRLYERARAGEVGRCSPEDV
jgi:hypothetical protein